MMEPIRRGRRSIWIPSKFFLKNCGISRESNILRVSSSTTPSALSIFSKASQKLRRSSSGLRT